MTLADHTERNRRLAANIAAGKSPLDAQVIDTIRQQGEALLDVPGPRVVQLVERIRELETRLKFASPGENYVRMNLALASGERIDAWVDMETAVRVWHA